MFLICSLFVSPLCFPVVVPRCSTPGGWVQVLGPAFLPTCARARVGGISPVRVEVLEPNLFIIFSFFRLYVSSFFSICHRLFIAFLCFFLCVSLFFIAVHCFFSIFHHFFIVFSIFFSIVLKFWGGCSRQNAVSRYWICFCFFQHYIIYIYIWLTSSYMSFSRQEVPFNLVPSFRKNWHRFFLSLPGWADVFQTANSAANFQVGHLIFGHNPQDRYSRLSVKIMRGKQKLPCTEPFPEEKLGQRSKQELSL